MVVGRLGGDSALGRLGADRLLRLSLCLAVAGVSTATLAPNRFVALAGFHVAGLGVAVLFPRIYDAAAQAPGRPGAALGAMTAGQRLGLFVAPVTVGALAGTSAISVGAAMALVTLPCAVTLAVLVPRVGHRRHPRVVEGPAPPYHAAG
jgi:fucose permease